MTKATTVVAAGGVTMPAWWPTLPEASNWAAQMVPVLSAVWLLIQIVGWMRRQWRDSEEGGARPVFMGASAAALALAAALIAPWEGVELRAYRDIVGVPTICYGETRGVEMGDTATLAECKSQLARAVVDFERGIRPCLPATLPDQTRAAFISASYNIGAGAFCGSSMSRRALAGNLRGACDALLMWDKAGGKVVRGLTRRRAAERSLCLEGLR